MKNNAKPNGVEVPIAPLLPRFLDFKKACEYGGFGKWKAHELIKAGKIDARKMDRRILINRASIDRYHDSLPKVTEARNKPR